VLFFANPLIGVEVAASELASLMAAYEAELSAAALTDWVNALEIAARTAVI
jgi:hypothetical protein